MITKQQNNTGSILIWTVLLGLVLTSVFFFLALRLGSLGAIQRDTIEYQGQKAYLESLVDYLKANPAELDLAPGKEPADTLFGEEVTATITLTQNVSEIVGFVDSGGDRSYTIDEEVDVEYNSCEGGVAVETGAIVTDPSGVSNTGYCALSQEYNDRITITPMGTLTITSVGAPTHFRIKPTTVPTIQDNLWHLDAQVEFGYGRSIEVTETFKSEP